MSKNPILVGLVGEYAVCEYLKRRGFQAAVDMALRPTGDGGTDIAVHGLRIQVKTSRRGQCFIRRVDKGRVIPLNSDLFVFAQWNDVPPDRNVALLGWIAREAIGSRCRYGKSPITGASHFNIKVDTSTLNPMNLMIDELHSRAVVA